MKFTSETLSGAHSPEDSPSQTLGFKAKTTDGQIAVYAKAAEAISAGAACLVLPDGTCALNGTGVSCKSEYAIPAGKYGYVYLVLTTKTVS